MSKRKLNEGVNDSRYELITPWGYVGYSILFAIPIVGLILLIVFSLDGNNLNRRSFARSYWCAVLLVIIGVAIFTALVGSTGVFGAMNDVLKELGTLAK